MGRLSRVWRAVEAVATVWWLISLLGGVVVAVVAAIWGAFAGLSPLAQVFAAIAVFVAATVAIRLTIEQVLKLVGRRREDRPDHQRPGSRTYDLKDTEDFQAEDDYSEADTYLKAEGSRNIRTRRVTHAQDDEQEGSEQ